jgi:hypothetical protein
LVVKVRLAALTLVAIAPLAAACDQASIPPFLLDSANDPEGIVREVINEDGWEILRALEERTGRRLWPLPEVVVLPRGDGCPPQRGGYSPDDDQVTIYLEGDEDAAWVRGVLSHELAHAVAHEEIGQKTGDPTLAEGFATWASVPYWAGWQPWADFDEAAQTPPAAFEAGECDTLNRDFVYARRAALLDWLVARFGRGKLYQALRSEAEDPFADVYGLSKAQLTEEFGAEVELELDITPGQ